MLHVRRSFMVLCDRCSVLVFYIAACFALIHSCRGQSEVIGPLQPVVALIGDDIILPCNLDPVMDAFDMTVEWARSDLDPRFVLVWRDGVDVESKKHPSYTRRTSLFTDELKNGNISLKISKVKLSDEGKYRCFVPELSKEITVQLVVGAASSPAAEINSTISSRVVLQCESAGWYPEPELLWLDGEGNLLSAGPTETLRGPDGFYTVSSRVTVEKRHSNNITCRVQQRNTNQSRETHIHVPDDFFIIISPPSNPTSNPNIAVVTVITVAVVLILIVAGFSLWKRRRDKFKNQRLNEEEGPEQMRQEKINYESDNSEFKVVVEEGESEPLLTAIEKENDVHGRGEQSHKDKRESQDQFKLETEQNIEVERPEEESNCLSVITETVSQFTTEQKPHEEEEATGREVETERSEGEGDTTIERVKEDSDLQPSLFTGEQAELEKEAETFHFHRETDTQQERPTESDVGIKQSDAEKKKRKRTNKQEKKKKETQKKKQEKNQREELEAKLQREENQRKLQSETQTEEERDTELLAQKDQHQQSALKGNQTPRSERQSEDEPDKKDHQRNERIAEPQRSVEDNMISPGSSKVIAFQRKTENQERQPEREPEESQEGSREQPEKLRRAESRRAQGEMVNIGTDETQKKDEEKEKLQIYKATMKQQQDINHKILREQPQESVSVTERGAECLGGLMEEEPLEADRTSNGDRKNVKRQKFKPERELHEVRQLTTRKAKNQSKSRTQLRKNSTILKENLKEEAKSDQMDDNPDPVVGDPNVIVKLVTLRQILHSEINKKEEMEPMDLQ